MRDQAALRCLLNDSWLILQDKSGAARPPTEIKRLFTADALAAPTTAVNCQRLMWFIGPRYAEVVRQLAAETPGVAPRVAEPVAGTSQPADLSVEQAAARLNLKPHSVRSAIRRGSLAAVKDNGTWRIQEQDVTAYAAR